MENPNYHPRLIDQTLETYLSAFGTVCIEGPKECGKTWTASHHCRSEIYLGDSAEPFHKRKLAELILNWVLEGETPR